MDYQKSDSKQAAKEQVVGVWAATTTPFTTDLEMDEEGLRKNFRYVGEKLKVDGVFCTGLMGEFWSLTMDETKRQIKIAAEEGKKWGFRVMPQTGRTSYKETIELANYAAEVGADYVVMLPPFFPGTTDKMAYEYFMYIAKRIDIGFFIFDTVLTGRPLSDLLYGELAKNAENFCGLKLGRGPQQHMKVKQATGNSIVINDPTEENLFDMMVNYDQTVHMSSPNPFLYQTAEKQPIRDYFYLLKEGKISEAAEINASLQPLREIYAKWYRNPNRELSTISVPAVKAWSELMGMAAGPVRPPMVDLTPLEKQELKDELIKAGLLK